jgi:hypothetical protein
MSTLKTNAIQTIAGKPLVNNTGNVINVYHAYDTTQALYVQTADINLTGLSITLTPTSTNSKFILQSVVHLTTNYVLGFGFKRNGSRIGKSTTGINAGMGINLTHIWWIAHQNNSYICEHPFQDIDIPNTTSSITYYPFYTNNWANSGSSAYYNTRNTFDMGSTSTFTIFEVVG